MLLHDAQNLAFDLMAEHGLVNNELGGPEWSFEFDRAVRRFGCCHWATKTISLSRSLVELNDEARVRNTLLHEIAHALAGPRNGHNRQWRSIAVAIGCDGNRLYDGSVVAKPATTVTGHCPNCNRIIKRHRRGNIACGVCCKRYNGGRYKEAYRIIWA